MSVITAQQVRDASKGKASESNGHNQIIAPPMKMSAAPGQAGNPASHSSSRPRAAICSAGRSRPLSMSRRTLSAKGFLVSQNNPAIDTTAPKASIDVLLQIAH